jgi:hypothetical protein
MCSTFEARYDKKTGRTSLRPDRDLRQLAALANRRYLDFLSSLDDPTVAVETVNRLSEKTEDAGRRYRGFNFFFNEDVRLFETIVRGEHTIQGADGSSSRPFDREAQRPSRFSAALVSKAR